MAFEAHIREVSHEGGMLAPFKGNAPKLGQVMQLPGGKWVGKVDTVIGEVSAAVVHITPFRDIEAQLLIGQPVEIAPPKERRDDRRGRRDNRDKSHMKDGDWTCSKCQNHNFAWRENCNRCEAPKGDSGDNNRKRRDNRGGDRRRGGGQRRDNRGGDRRGGGGGQRRDNRGGDRRGGGGGYRGGGDRRDNRGGDRRGGGGQRRDNRGGDRRGGGPRRESQGGNQRDSRNQRPDSNRPPRREYKGSNDRKPKRRDSRGPGGWGPKGKGGSRRR